MKQYIIKNGNINNDLIYNEFKKNNSIVGCFSHQCHYCLEMKPEWEKLKKRLRKVKTDCIFIEIEAEFLNKLAIDEISNKVNGFPSIMLFKNGKFYKTFQDKRTSKTMYDFLKPLLKLKKNKTKHKKKLKSNRTKRKY